MSLPLLEAQVVPAQALVGGQRGGVGPATTLPRLSTMPWSAMASALRAFCSTSSTVSPESSRSWRTRSMTWATILGARPSDGSSSSSTRGAVIRARAMTRICRSPPDSVAASCRRRSPSTGKLLVDARPAPRPAGRRSPQQQGRARRFSSTVSSVMTPWPSGTCATPARAMSSGLRRARLAPSSRIRPEPRPDQPGDGAQQRGLARAVGAEHGGDRAGLAPRARPRPAPARPVAGDHVLDRERRALIAGLTVPRACGSVVTAVAGCAGRRRRSPPARSLFQRWSASPR